MATKHKINSMTLESGVIVEFKDNGMIKLYWKNNMNVHVELHTTDLDTIRLQAIKNGRIEADNGVEPTNKETAK